MDKDTLIALLGSIAKWQALAQGIGKDGGTDDCHLCQKFLADELSQCKGCPVAQKTGRPFCINTPYKAWARFTDKEDVDPKSPQGRALAQAELDFLTSLLPPEVLS